MSLRQADRRSWGWWLAATLAFMLSYQSQAEALDLDHEIRRKEGVSSEIRNTLGRDRGQLKVKHEDLPSLDESDMVEDYKVELIPVKRDKSS